MKRELAWQAVLLVLVAGLAWQLLSVTQANLARLGVDSSVDFLWQRAGFEISQKLIPYNADSTIARAFAVALLNTLVLAVAAIVGATLIGTAIGLARLSDNWLVSRLALVYIEIFRNIPSLLQIFFWYFAALRALPRTDSSLALFDCVFLNNRGLFLPVVHPAGGWWWLAAALLLGGAALGLWRWGRQRQHRHGQRRLAARWGLLALAGLAGASLLLADLSLQGPQPTRFGFQGGLVLMPEFLSLAVGLSMYNATYIGEIVRSGFVSVPKGQWEAADSLGLPRHLAIRLVLFPQALRAIIPPLSTVYLNLFKGTSLAAAIAYPEVVSVFAGTVNNLVGQPVFIMALTLAVYVFVSLCIALFLNWRNRRIAPSAAP